MECSEKSNGVQRRAPHCRERKSGYASSQQYRRSCLLSDVLRIHQLDRRRANRKPFDFESSLFEGGDFASDKRMAHGSDLVVLELTAEIAWNRQRLGETHRALVMQGRPRRARPRPGQRTGAPGRRAHP